MHTRRTMTRKDLEDEFGKSSARIADGLKRLGFPVTRQAVHKWRKQVPHRSAAIIQTVTRGRLKA